MSTTHSTGGWFVEVWKEGVKQVTLGGDGELCGLDPLDTEVVRLAGEHLLALVADPPPAPPADAVDDDPSCEQMIQEFCEHGIDMLRGKPSLPAVPPLGDAEVERWLEPDEQAFWWYAIRTVKAPDSDGGKTERDAELMLIVLRRLAASRKAHAEDKAHAPLPDLPIFSTRRRMEELFARYGVTMCADTRAGIVDAIIILGSKEAAEKEAHAPTAARLAEAENIIETLSSTSFMQGVDKRWNHEVLIRVRAFLAKPEAKAEGGPTC